MEELGEQRFAQYLARENQIIRNLPTQRGKTLSSMPHRLPISRVQKFMKRDIAEELPPTMPRFNVTASAAPLMVAACEMLIAEMTIKSGTIAEYEKRKTIQKRDI